MRSARGQSSSPPARMGRIMTPGENHSPVSWAAAMPMITTDSASSPASLRFLVMNWRLATPRARRADVRATDRIRPVTPPTMMAALYRYLPVPGHARGLDIRSQDAEPSGTNG